MEYYRPAAGAYPVGPELGDEGPPFGALDRGFRRGGEYARQPGYGGVPGGYVDDEFERVRPLGAEPYLGGGGAPEFYGPMERPGRHGYGREGYAPSMYDQGYPLGAGGGLPPVDYLEVEASDLGMGLRDAGSVASHHGGGFDAGFGRPELPVGYGGAPGYGGGGRRPAGYGHGGAYGDNDEVRRLRHELEQERRKKHELEAAAAAAVGYGLHERHEKSDAEEEAEEEDGGKKEKSRLRQFFSRD